MGTKYFLIAIDERDFDNVARAITASVGLSKSGNSVTVQGSAEDLLAHLRRPVDVGPVVGRGTGRGGEEQFSCPSCNADRIRAGDAFCANCGIVLSWRKTLTFPS